jgi:hypothetical protein
MGTDREQAVLANRARLLALDGPPPPVRADVADGLLRSTVCARCGYELTGLSQPTGACPECGRAYGGPEVCLYGYAAGGKQTAWTRKPLSLRRIAFVWTCVGVAALVLAPFWRMITLTGLWYWPVSWLGFLGVVTWRGLSDQPSDAVQVRLTPAGVRQMNRGWGPIPYDRVDRARPTPWAKVRHVAVKPAGDGQVRVTMASSTEPWTFQRIYVDAIVRCPPEADAALRQRLAEWRAGGDRR